MRPAARAGPGRSRARARTGLVIDPYFSGTKLRWLLDQVPGAHVAAAQGELAFGTIDSWLLWQLTGGRVHATDVSNAARTMLFDIRHNVWDQELLQALHVPHSVLPQVHAVEPRLRRDDGLFGAPIPIAGIAGDQQAALFGQACFQPGLAKNTYGTGCFMLMHTGGRFQASTHGLVTTAAAQPTATPEYALEGSVFIGGAVVQWLRDGLRAIDGSGEVQALAESVPDSGGVIVRAGLHRAGRALLEARGARRHRRPEPRQHGGAHRARGAREHRLPECGAAAGDGREPRRRPAELRVDGGASVNDLLMQFQADLLGVPVVRPLVTETTALGAAIWPAWPPASTAAWTNWRRCGARSGASCRRWRANVPPNGWRRGTTRCARPWRPSVRARARYSTAKSCSVLPAASASRSHCGRLPMPPQVWPASSRNFTARAAGLAAARLRPFFAAGRAPDLAARGAFGARPRSSAVSP